MNPTFNFDEYIAKLTLMTGLCFVTVSLVLFGLFGIGVLFWIFVLGLPLLLLSSAVAYISGIMTSAIVFYLYDATKNNRQKVEMYSGIAILLISLILGFLGWMFIISNTVAKWGSPVPTLYGSFWFAISISLIVFGCHYYSRHLMIRDIRKHKEKA